MGQPALSNPVDRPVRTARGRRLAQTAGCADPRACGPEVEDAIKALAPLLTLLGETLEVVEIATAVVLVPESVVIVGGAMLMTGDSEGDSDSTKEHTKGARESTRNDHEEGQARKARDRGGEKADKAGRRRPPRKRPADWQGKWPR